MSVASFEVGAQSQQGFDLGVATSGIDDESVEQCIKLLSSWMLVGFTDDNAFEFILVESSEFVGLCWAVRVVFLGTEMVLGLLPAVKSTVVGILLSVIVSFVKVLLIHFVSVEYEDKINLIRLEFKFMNRVELCSTVYPIAPWSCALRGLLNFRAVLYILRVLPTGSNVGSLVECYRLLFNT